MYNIIIIISFAKINNEQNYFYVFILFLFKYKKDDICVTTFQ